MVVVDWIALGIVVLAALNGLRTGLVTGALSLAGLLAGAWLGARIAPEILGGGESLYTPLIALGGAVAAAVFLQGIAGLAGGAVRRSLFVLPPLRWLDTAGGALLGALTGLALVWVLGAAALHLPGQADLRRAVQESTIVSRLNQEVPPQRLLDAIARVDPFGAIAGPDANVPPPDPRLAGAPGVRAAAESVLRVTGSACGLGIEGSGWIAAPNTVVTNAHVVAGVRDARVDRRDGRTQSAEVVSFDAENDVAVLRVPGLRGRPLELVDPQSGVAVAILGYPENGPLTSTPGRIGQTARVFAEDAYGRGPLPRTVTTLRGEVRRGNSGGPAVDEQGRVHTTIFAARANASSGGYGIPAEQVRRALSAASAGRVDTGPCVR